MNKDKNNGKTTPNDKTSDATSDTIKLTEKTTYVTENIKTKETIKVTKHKAEETRTYLSKLVEILEPSTYGSSSLNEAKRS